MFDIVTNRRNALQLIMATITATASGGVLAERSFPVTGSDPYENLSDATIKGMYRHAAFERIDHTCFMLSMIDEKGIIHIKKGNHKTDPNLAAMIKTLEEIKEVAEKTLIPVQLQGRQALKVAEGAKDIITNFLRIEDRAAALVRAHIDKTPKYRERLVAEAEGKPYDSVEGIGDRHYFHFINLSCQIDLIKDVIKNRIANNSKSK